MSAQHGPTTPDLLAVRERRLSLRSAMGTLENALAAPAAGRPTEWSPGVEVALAQLQARMNEHVAATEGPTGFHQEMVTAAPRLVHEVDLSVREHGLILDLVDDLLGRVNVAVDDGAPAKVAEIRATGTRVLAVLARHRQRGSDMIFEAYESDLGGGD